MKKSGVPRVGDGSGRRRGARDTAGRDNDSLPVVCERGMPWFPGRCGGTCAPVNPDRIAELRDHLREHGLLPREELAGLLQGGGEERWTSQMRRAMGVLAGESAVAGELVIMEQDEQRCGSWANRWLARASLHLKRARRLEADG
jgi:hypothetical protein